MAALHSMRHADKVTDYINRTFTRRSAKEQQMRAEAEQLRPGMQISPYEGEILALLVRLCGAQHILEIGAFAGYSAIAMASALPEGGRLITLERDADYAKLARSNIETAGLTDKVTLLEGDALEHMAALTPGFDMVFIDAEKRRYPDYLLAAEKLISPGALVVGDNTLLFGALIGEPLERVSGEAIASMAKFNERLADPAHYHGIMIPTQQGMTIAIKK